MKILWLFIITLAGMGLAPLTTAALAGDGLIPADPSSAYLSELAQMNVRYEQIAEAVTCFEKAIAKAGSADEKGRNAFSMAQVLIRMQKPEAATNAFRIAMESKPNDTPFLCQCHTFLAQCLLQRRKPAEAEQSFRYVMANSGNDWERTNARDQLYALLIQSGRSDELIKTLKDQVGGDTNNPALLLELASAYAMQTNGQELAIGLYNQVLEKDPGNKEALERTIMIYRSTARYEDAVGLIQKLYDATKDQDRKKELADRAATLCRMGGDVPAAVVWQAKTVELDPANPVPLLKLGETYASRGDWTNAIVSYQGAVSKATTDTERDSFTMLLIETQIRGGNAGDAETAMRKLADSGSSDQVKVKARRLLFDLYEKQGRLGEVSFPPLKTEDFK